jgi:hypothetical protein
VEKIDSVASLYDALRQHISKLASATKSSTQVLMERDEIVGELSCELVKGWLYYKDRELPDNELLAVVCRMLQNRLAELQTMHYYTHRKAAGLSRSVDDSGFDVADPATVEDYVESAYRVARFFESLSIQESAVVRSLLGDDRRIRQQLIIRNMRRSFVFKNTVIKYDYKLVADALHMPHSEARAVWFSILDKWRQSG